MANNLTSESSYPFVAAHYVSDLLRQTTTTRTADNHKSKTLPNDIIQYDHSMSITANITNQQASPIETNNPLLQQYLKDPPTSPLTSLVMVDKSDNDTLTNQQLNEWQSSELFNINIALTIIYLIIMFVGVIGNICNCLVIADSRNRYMKTPTNYYLFSLSTSDLLLLIFGLPHDLVNIWHPSGYMFNRFVCFSRGWISEASTNASVLVIVAFTVERYLAICHPLRAHKWSHLDKSVKIICSIWLVASSCAFLVVWQYGLILVEDIRSDGTNVKIWLCTSIANGKEVFTLSVIIFFILPMAIITILYVKLGYHLRQNSRLHNKQSQKPNNHHSSSVTKTSGTNCTVSKNNNYNSAPTTNHQHRASSSTIMIKINNQTNPSIQVCHYDTRSTHDQQQQQQQQQASLTGFPKLALGGQASSGADPPPSVGHRGEAQSMEEKSAQLINDNKDSLHMVRVESGSRRHLDCANHGRIMEACDCAYEEPCQINNNETGGFAKSDSCLRKLARVIGHRYQEEEQNQNLSSLHANRSSQHLAHRPKGSPARLNCIEQISDSGSAAADLASPNRSQSLISASTNVSSHPHAHSHPSAPMSLNSNVNTSNLNSVIKMLSKYRFLIASIRASERKKYSYF